MERPSLRGCQMIVSQLVLLPGEWREVVEFWKYLGGRISCESSRERRNQV